ncbi:MAG: HEAT repeat domain-containing protein [Acidobacteriota bacterium]
MTGRLITVFIFFSITTAYSLADNDVYTRLLSFNYGQSREAFWTIEKRIREANDQQRLEIEKALLTALRSPEATVAAKQSICALLTNIASCRSVTELASLLRDQQTQDAARGTLQGLACPEVDKLFRDALATSKGAARLALISSIGARKDRGAVALLGALLNNSDLAVVETTLAALGRIGGDPAVTLVGQAVVPPSLQAAKADAYLKCAESFSREGRPSRAEEIYQKILKDPTSGSVARAGALRGLVLARREASLDQLLDALKSKEVELRQAASRLVNEVTGPKATQRVLEVLPAVPPDTQVFLVSALANRADPAALPELKKQSESSFQPVQLAALEAFGRLGDQTCVETLFQASKRPDPVGATAADSLRFLRGPGVNESIARYLKDSDAALRVLALKTLAARRFPAIGDRAFELLSDRDARVRFEAWRTLGSAAGPGSLPRLVSEMLKLSELREQQTAEQAVQATAMQLPESTRLQPLTDAMTAAANSSQRCSVLRAMGRIGGETAFATIRTALSDTDPAVQDTAVRSLADWGDLTTAADLLKLARSASSPAHRILGFRGYVRLARSLDRGKAEDQVTMFREALGIAEREEEKRLVLGALGGVPSVGALDLVEPYLADPALKNEAQAACLRLAQSVARQEPGRARAALLKLLETSEDPALRRQAQDGLKELEN